jgi:23S rRNA (pseudouridine1915-N3)-methyltransferase
MNLHITATARKRSTYDDMITDYSRRITKPFTISTTLLEPAGHENALVCIDRENSKVIDSISSNDYVIALDERGHDITTKQLAKLLEQLNNQSTKQVVFIIGGAYGIDDRIRARANATLRISSLTLPHELARLILIEQLYRATNILAGGKYHH